MDMLTKKEEQVYKYLKTFIEVDGYAPSVRDICRDLGIKSTSSVHHMLHSLASKGCITLADGRSRAIRITDNGLSTDSETIRVPLLSSVSNGFTMPSASNVNGYVDFPKVMAKDKNNLFALRVTGKGMTSEGILNGDIAIIESGKYASQNGYVAVLLNDDYYIMKAIVKGGLVSLVSDEWQNGLSSEKCTILGRLIANFRFF